MSKYDLNLQLKVAKEYELGNSANDLSKKYNIKTATIENWIQQYKSFGEEGLKKSMSKTKYSGEFKLSVNNIDKYMVFHTEKQQSILISKMDPSSSIGRELTKKKGQMGCFQKLEDLESQENPT